MNKKKKLIIEGAKTLFNEKGYSQVTIRMIALKLEMSSGNLNYHYQKREDIFEALYFEMVAAFDERLAKLEDVEVSIPQIRQDIEQSMHRMIDYKFFWTDLYNLLSVSDHVKTHFQAVYKSRIDGCLLLFEKLEKQGLMRGSSFKLEYHFLAEQIVNYGNTWLYASNLYANKNENIAKVANTLLSFFYPYLTPKGQLEFKNEMPTLFE